MESNSPENLPSKEITLDIAGKSEPSLRHPEHNEDSFSFGNDWVVVLDGLGGYQNGERASRTGLDVMKKSLVKMRPKGYIDVEIKSDEAANDANKKIRNKAPGGGSTLLFGKVFEKGGIKNIFIGNLGDSRAYLLRDGVLTKITEDDNSYSRDMADKFDHVNSNEDLTVDEQEAFKFRNLIKSYLGKGSTAAISPYVRELMRGDVYVFTTDGVHDNLTTPEIETVVKAGGDIATELVGKAKSRSMEGSFRSKMDDITAVAVKVK